jgi:beta-mannosidase
MIDLAGVWSLSDEGGDHQVPFDVPGDAITALHKASAIPDPYWGRNEYGLRWISERDWVARRTFEHDGSASDLVITELDCVAEVRLNGHRVLQAENAFRRWRVDVSGALRQGVNEIEVTFRSSIREGADRQKTQPFFVPWNESNNQLANGNMLRKQQSDFGWDWNIALAPFGIYGTVALEPKGARISDIIVSQRHEPDLATVSIIVHAIGQEVTATLCGVTARAEIHLGVARLSLVITKPVLWWPAGLGDQTLHTLTVTCGAAIAVRRIGLRSLVLDSRPDDTGRSFGFVVNGHPTFTRGANWIPADALAGRINPDEVRDLLQSSVLANMNMIRVWGGGRYEPDWFYDLCDEMGLMVWQDFMFSCNLYPSTPTYLAEVNAEVRDVVSRINHHACIAVWCGDNELIGALSWFECSRKDRDRYLVSYDRLNRTIESALSAVLPDANWWPSSPSPGPMAFGDAWHDDSSGDMHFWSVWHEGRDFDHYRDVKPRFCSEFGFQSYPSMDVIRKFAGPADFNIASPVMESHQKNAGGNARIAETMFRYFRFPVDFESFVYLSQVQQGLAIKTAVTQWRSLKPHCMGTLYWQLNDTWPVCSWSSLDHGGGWKLMHHMARSFYAPVTVVAVPDGAAIILRAVNDTRGRQKLGLKVSALSMAGNLRPLLSTKARVGTDASIEIARIDRADLQHDEVLHWSWTGDHPGSDFHAPRPWKSYDLIEPEVTMEIKTSGGLWQVDLAAQALAPFVAVAANVAGRFSANAVLLIPGEPCSLTFTPEEWGTIPDFSCRHLYSATCGSPT